jgi:hypothetical protein
MTREKDPAEIVQTIAQSIEVGQRKARRVRAHRFKELFGYHALTAQRRERIEHLMAEAGIVEHPSLEDAGRDDWLVMSMPVKFPVPEAHPDPRPTAEWFEHMKSVRPDTEREVEIHFASPLFQDGWAIARTRKQQGLAFRCPWEALARSVSRLTCFTSLMSGAIWTTASRLCSSNPNA